MSESDRNEVDRLREVIQKLRDAGRPMATFFYNWSQPSSTFDGRQRPSMKAMQVAWDEMQALTDWRKAHGHWDRRRAAQARHWFEQVVRHELLAQLGEAKVQTRMIELGDKVTQGALSESAAARTLLEALKNR